MTIAGASRRLRRFVALSLREKIWCFAALCLLAAARATVLLLPVSAYSGLFGRDAGVQPLSLLINEQQCLMARRIGHVVVAIANLTPWRSRCLEQALVAKILLHWYRIPSVVYLGVARDASASMRAHAWISAGPVYVTGGCGFTQFTVVRNYVGMPIEQPALSPRS